MYTSLHYRFVYQCVVDTFRDMTGDIFKLEKLNFDTTERIDFELFVVSLCMVLLHFTSSSVLLIVIPLDLIYILIRMRRDVALYHCQ